MAVMVSRVLSSLTCVLCVILLPAVWADYCTSYWHKYNFYHEAQQCGDWYCCGGCDNKYCCHDSKYQITLETQKSCPVRPSSEKKLQRTGMVVGGIFVSVFPFVICVTLIICCVSPCCWCYKKCRRRRNQGQITVINTTVVQPQQPLTPSGYQLPYPAYQAVPVQPGYREPHMPAAPPPSYLEATAPSYFPVGQTEGQPVHPSQPPVQPYAPSPYSTELVQPPYNPAYGIHV